MNTRTRPAIAAAIGQPHSPLVSEDTRYPRTRRHFRLKLAAGLPSAAVLCMGRVVRPGRPGSPLILQAMPAQNRLSGRPKCTLASSPAVLRYWAEMWPWYMAVSR